MVVEVQEQHVLEGCANQVVVLFGEAFEKADAEAAKEEHQELHGGERPVTYMVVVGCGYEVDLKAKDDHGNGSSDRSF